MRIDDLPTSDRVEDRRDDRLQRESLCRPGCLYPRHLGTTCTVFHGHADVLPRAVMRIVCRYGGSVEKKGAGQ
jgi:hypothetical protein